MNILIIGNGFDLAHGLPTTYKDFLKFADECMEFKKAKDEHRELSFDDDKDTSFLRYIINLYNNKRSQFDELIGLIENNSWFKHFKQGLSSDGWIDFEREISEIIQILDKMRKKVKNSLLTDCQIEEPPLIEQKRLNAFDINCHTPSLEEILQQKVKLLTDLNRLTRCLEMYLSDYVNNIDFKLRIPQIEKFHADMVLSFNYTNTYERTYGKETKAAYDYIHGEAALDKTVESCNLVLGIDEYLPEEEQDIDNEFIQFKKFFQRIYKKTGCKYVDWFPQDKSLSGGASKHEVIIWGHSLNITDKDILSEIILNPTNYITIYYHNQEALGNQIANMVKVIGEKKLISMVHGKRAPIRFEKG